MSTRALVCRGLHGQSLLHDSWGGRQGVLFVELQLVEAVVELLPSGVSARPPGAGCARLTDSSLREMAFFAFGLFSDR